MLIPQELLEAIPVIGNLFGNAPRSEEKLEKVTLVSNPTPGPLSNEFTAKGQTSKGIVVTVVMRFQELPKDLGIYDEVLVNDDLVMVM